MSRWALALALLVSALAPSRVSPGPGTTTVRVLKSNGPYRNGDVATRWIPSGPPRPIAPPLSRAPSAEPAPVAPPAPLLPAPVTALARARACKVFDRNANGWPDGGEPMVEGWKFRLSHAQRGSKVRATEWDGCAEFTGLQPGTFQLTEVLPPFWEKPERETIPIEVTAGNPKRAPPAYVSGGCVHFAHLGGTDFWLKQAGLRLLDETDQRLVNSLEPFQAPSPAFRRGAEPFDGRLADGVTPVHAIRYEDGAWGEGTWEAELVAFLADRRVSADPRGRLAQEILVFALNAKHFLENAQVIYVEEAPAFVDDLIFEGVLAWHAADPAWNHEMTALLAGLNGSESLGYVPGRQCQVAYLPF